MKKLIAMLLALMTLCYCSAIMVAMLRSQGVPARLVIGTIGKGYHAWVSVVLDGKERAFDPTASLCGKKYSAKEYKVERYY